MSKKPGQNEQTAPGSAKKKASKAPAKSKRVGTSKVTKAKAEPIKEKRIRGSFSMPARDYALIAELKSISKSSGRAVKKNELLRAGLRALIAMTDQALQLSLSALDPQAAKRNKKAKKN